MIRSKAITKILFATIISISFSIPNTCAQEAGYGGSAIYNFMTGGIGFDLRARLPLSDFFYAVPEVSYFPGFNPYHEYLVGAALHFEFLEAGKSSLYLAAGGYYNNWLNFDKFTSDQKRQHNFSPQAGGGIIFNKGCFRPFIEDRYDFKWKENTLRIGLMIYPKSCKKNKDNCPALPNS